MDSSAHEAQKHVENRSPKFAKKNKNRRANPTHCLQCLGIQRLLKKKEAWIMKKRYDTRHGYSVRMCIENQKHMRR